MEAHRLEIHINDPDEDAPVDFWKWLADPHGGGCVASKDLGEGVYAGIKPLLFHWTMLVGEIGNTVSYEDRYCFQTRELAEEALKLWDGRGDPINWHRHPRTGRRRVNGDPATEYVDR